MAVPPAWQGSRAGRQRRGLDPGDTGRLGHGVGTGHVVQRDPPHVDRCCRCADLHVSLATDLDSGRCWDRTLGGLLPKVVRAKPMP